MLKLVPKIVIALGLLHLATKLGHLLTHSVW
jgi:hypothetical protein